MAYGKRQNGLIPMEPVMSDAYDAFAFGPTGLQPYRVAEASPRYEVRTPGASVGLAAVA